MNLLYKPDWEETKERYLAWWAHEALDRCAIAVTAPQAGKPSEKLPPTMPSDPVERWTNLEWISAWNDYTHSRTFYRGGSAGFAEKGQEMVKGLERLTGKMRRIQ